MVKLPQFLFTKYRVYITQIIIPWCHNILIKFNILTCKHEWINESAFKRRCKRCSLIQRLQFYRFGPIRSAWIDEKDYYSDLT